MSKGVWPAVSGSIAQSERLDVVANNLANVNTLGFKRDQAAFRQVLTDAVNAAMKEDIPRRAFTDKDFYRLDGRDQAFVALDGVYTDHSPGMIKNTGAPFDLAIEGKGFFEVLTPNGVRFTRHGSFHLNPDGTLVTLDGYPVLSKTSGTVATDTAGNPAPAPTREELAARAIVINSAKPGAITISKDGAIYNGKELANEISVVEFVDHNQLSKEGGAMFRNESQANIIREVAATNVRQGMLETSNVNPVKELTDMLSATRMFEANQKVVKSYGELEGRAVNDIGKL